MSRRGWWRRGMSEVQILHAWRRALLRSKRLGLPDWSEEELAYVRGRIDELEEAELGLGWWRHQLLWMLRKRLVDLITRTG